MDKENGNISSTFGKYRNESIGQVKDVSSSDWVPISTGKSLFTSSQGASQPQRQTQGKRPSSTKGTSAKKGGKTAQQKPQKKRQATGLDGVDLISGGNTPQKKASQQSSYSDGKKTTDKAASQKNKKASGKAASAQKENASKKQAPGKGSQQQKNSSATRNNDSRTPIRKQQRDDQRKQHKHNEGVRKSQQDRRESAKDGVNHDEYCKQKNETKRLKNSIRRFLKVAGVLVFAVFVIGVICYSKGTPIENIIIEGNTVYSDEEIYQAAGIAEGRNLYVFSEKKVKHDITTKLPYIKDVTLEKDYPDTLILRIVPTQDKYVITSPSGWITLDKDGKVVSLTRDKVEPGMYQIDGFDYQKVRVGETYVPEESNAERYRIMREMVTLFDNAEVIDTAVIKLQNVDDVVVEHGGNIAVYFGKCENLEIKVPGASGILEIAIAKKAKGYIDMRYKDRGSFVSGSMTIQ